MVLYARTYFCSPAKNEERESLLKTTKLSISHPNKSNNSHDFASPSKEQK